MGVLGRYVVSTVLAYTLMVDAATGKVLYRENKVEHAYAAASEGATQMQGAITATACGPKHEFELTDGNTKQIAVAATAVNPANDIVIKIFGPGGEVLTNGDRAVDGIDARMTERCV